MPGFTEILFDIHDPAVESVHGLPAPGEELSPQPDGTRPVARGRLLDSMPGPDGKGRVPISALTLRIGADAVRLVCGESLAEGAVVMCSRCATPHDRDCGISAGRCFAFACGETCSR